MAANLTVGTAPTTGGSAPRPLALRPENDACPGCGVLLRRRSGPLHAYLGASSACWEAYQRLARPSSVRPDSPRVRRLLQDAYAAQHPGEPAVRSVRSIAVHLMDLCALLERAGDVGNAVPVPGRTSPRRALDLHWLEPPRRRGRLTVVDALDPRPSDRRADQVEAWASQVWAAWEPHHETVRRWLDAVPARRAATRR
jgi:hypothetical protein